MPNITVCPNCGKAYEAFSEEAANEPSWGPNPYARYCADCWQESTAFDRWTEVE